MEIDSALIKRVAKVARLSLSDAEVKQFIPQIKTILEAFSKLKEVDTRNTPPSFHPVELKNRLREDKPRPSLSVEEAIQNTSHKRDHYFKGPKTM